MVHMCTQSVTFSGHSRRWFTCVHSLSHFQGTQGDGSHVYTVCHIFRALKAMVHMCTQSVTFQVTQGDGSHVYTVCHISGHSRRWFTCVHSLSHFQGTQGDGSHVYTVCHIFRALKAMVHMCTQSVTFSGHTGIKAIVHMSLSTIPHSYQTLCVVTDYQMMQCC